MIKNITIDYADIHILTFDKDIKIPINSIKSMNIYRDKNLDIGLMLIFPVLAVLYVLIYFYFENIFFLNVTFLLLTIIIIKEFITIQKSKYYFIIVTQDKKKYKHKFKSNLNYDVFFVRYTINDYLWKKLNYSSTPSDQNT